MYRWPATYFDGVSATRHTATVGSTAEGIAFALEDGTVRQWSSREYHLHVAPGRSHLRFEHQPYRGEAIQVEDAAAVSALMAGSSLGVSRQSHIFALTALCFAAAAGLYFSIPYVTAGIARLMPRTMEERLGHVVVSSLVAEEDRVALNPQARPILDRLFSAADPSWKYEVTWERTGQINALAAPGGQLVVFCGLVRAMESPEELAAILAHEVTHVTERHSTRNLVRTMGARMALSLFGGADVLVDSAAMLGALHYMRADEEAADAGGQALLLRAGIDPAAMERAFGRMEKSGMRIPAYLSSHPSTADRRKRAAEFAKVNPQPARVLMNSEDWRRLQSGCETH
jgi:predicted Zn-dependent protease